MVSDVDLCNMALDLVGQTNIAGRNDGSSVGSIVERHFQQTVREVLRDGKWKSARKSQVQLAVLANSPAIVNGTVNPSTTYPQVGGWPPGNILPVSNGGTDPDAVFPASSDFSWFFQLPADFLRLVRFNDQDTALMTDPLFEINGNILLAAQDVVYIDYVSDVTQDARGAAYGVNVLDPMLVKAIAYALAVKLSWRFTQSKTQMDSLKQDAEMYLRKARAVDLLDEKVVIPNQAQESEWIKSRWISTNN